MPAGIDVMKAAAAMNLSDAGYGASEIGRQLNLPQSTVRYIVGRHGKWGEIAEKPLFAKYRAEQNQHLEAASRFAAKELLARAFDEDKLNKASTLQLVTAFGITLDKARLLAGEPTEITQSVNLHAVSGLDKLAALLSQSLVEVDATDQGATEAEVIEGASGDSSVS